MLYKIEDIVRSTGCTLFYVLGVLIIVVLIIGVLFAVRIAFSKVDTIILSNRIEYYSKLNDMCAKFPEICAIEGTIAKIEKKYYTTIMKKIERNKEGVALVKGCIVGAFFASFIIFIVAMIFREFVSAGASFAFLFCFTLKLIYHLRMGDFDKVV